MTSARPDIVIIGDVTITLLELIISINTKGLHNAREQKLYLKKTTLLLLGNLQSKGFIAELETMEVDSLGHFSSVAIHSIHAILSHLNAALYVICCSPSQKRLSCFQVISQPV